MTSFPANALAVGEVEGTNNVISANQASENENTGVTPDYISDIVVTYSGSPLASDYYCFDKEQKEQSCVFPAGRLRTILTFTIKVLQKDNLYLNVQRNGAVINTYKSDVKIEGEEVTIKPFVNKSDENTARSDTFTITVGEKYDSNADGSVTAEDDFAESTTYTIKTTSIPRLDGIKLLDSKSQSIIDIPYPNSNYFKKDFYATTSSAKVSVDYIHFSAKELYIGSYGPYTQSVTASNNVVLDINDYLVDGNNTACIPLKMSNPSTGVEYTYNIWITYNDTDTPMIESMEDVVCNKNDSCKLSPQVTCENTGVLSYQWYSKDFKNETAQPISEATGATLDVPTDWAGTTYYVCEVTNTVTVDGEEKQYVAKSNEVAVTVNLSEVSAPIIQKQPGTYSLTNQGSEYSDVYTNEYTAGQLLDDLFVRVRRMESGTNYSAQFFYNTTASTEGSLAMKGSATAVSGSAHYMKYQDSLKYYDFSFISAEALPVGEYYIYCVLTATAEDDSEKTAATTSDFVKVVVNKLETPMSGNGTQEDPYLISSGEDLEWIRQQVANGNPFNGTYFKLIKDVTLPDNWSPIGCTKDGSKNIDAGRNLNPFSGIIDGAKDSMDPSQGCYTLTVPAGSLPLLGYVKGATVKNLNIYGEQIEGYGLVNNFEGVGLSGSAIVIDNVTLKQGTQTLQSGLIGANITTNHYAGTSAGFVGTIRNCTIEEGVVVGYTGEYDQIGSIAGRFQGTIDNCVSYATVKGKDYVGGLVGNQDQAMGACSITNSQFHGAVEASGSFVGGIIGGGYDDFGEASAPNGKRPTVQSCSVDGIVSGNACVGGITGGDPYVAQTWENVLNSIVGNSFTGVVSGNEYVGGIIGYYKSLNRYDTVLDNSYSSRCGAEKGIGFVEYIDTDYADPQQDGDTLIFSTNGSTANCPQVKWCAWKANHYRDDDPLGLDADKLCRKIDMAEIRLAGTYKTEYTVGEDLDLTGMEIKVCWSDGTTTSLDWSQVEITGFDKGTAGEQAVTITYGDLSTSFSLIVRAESSKDIDPEDKKEPTDPKVTPTAEPTATPTVTPTGRPTGTSTGASKNASAGSSATTGTRTTTVASTQAVKTGDDTNLPFWFLALMVSCMALVGVRVNSRKRRK